MSTHCSESSIHGLISYFKISDRKEQQQQQSRITSVVYNPHGTEILASYSSECLYLLDPKQSISQEKMKDHFHEHRNRTRTSTNTKENKSTTDNHTNEKTSPVKRLRLRGDWSDTGNSFFQFFLSIGIFSLDSGPDSRPVNNEPSQPTADSPPTSVPDRSPQNVFMQRMSDLLTQLVTRTTTNTDTQETEPTAMSESAAATSQTNATASPAGTDPIVQSLPSPPWSAQSPSTTTNDNEAAESDVSFAISNLFISFLFSVPDFSIYSSVVIEIFTMMMMMMKAVWMTTTTTRMVAMIT